MHKMGMALVVLNVIFSPGHRMGMLCRKIPVPAFGNKRFRSAAPNIGMYNMAICHTATLALTGRIDPSRFPVRFDVTFENCEVIPHGIGLYRIQPFPRGEINAYRPFVILL